MDTYNQISEDPVATERSTHNYRFQLRYGAAATGTVMKGGRRRSVRSMKIAQRKDSMDRVE